MFKLTLYWWQSNISTYIWHDMMRKTVFYGLLLLSPSPFDSLLLVLMFSEYNIIRYIFPYLCSISSWLSKHGVAGQAFDAVIAFLDWEPFNQGNVSRCQSDSPIAQVNERWRIGLCTHIFSIDDYNYSVVIFHVSNGTHLDGKRVWWSGHVADR